MAKTRNKAETVDSVATVVSVAGGVASGPASDAAAPPAEATKAQSTEPAFLGRLRELERTAIDVAKKRLAGTRAEKVVEKVAETVAASRGELEQLPARMEKELDGFLDRTLDKVGLVRKSRLEIVDVKPAGEATESTTQAA